MSIGAKGKKAPRSIRRLGCALVVLTLASCWKTADEKQVDQIKSNYSKVNWTNGGTISNPPDAFYVQVAFNNVADTYDMNIVFAATAVWEATTWTDPCDESPFTLYDRSGNKLADFLTDGSGQQIVDFGVTGGATYRLQLWSDCVWKDSPYYMFKKTAIAYADAPYKL